MARLFAALVVVSVTTVAFDRPWLAAGCLVLDASGLLVWHRLKPADPWVELARKP